MIRKSPNKNPTLHKPTKGSRKGTTLSSSEIKELADDGIFVDNWSIAITGEITEHTYRNVLKAVHILVEAPELTLFINSTGGDWDYGIAIYDLLKNQRRAITTVVQGCAQSMGSIIFQAGDRRLMAPNSYLMIHDGSEGISGSPSDVQAYAKHSAWVQETMYRVYAEASKKPAAYYKKLCRADCYIPAEAAIELGLADGYTD